MIQTRLLAAWGGLVSIRTGSTVGRLALASLRSFVDDAVDRLFRGEIGDELRDLLRGVAVPGAGTAASLRSSPRTSIPWIDRLLMLSCLDLVEEPGAVADRDLGLGRELPEDQPEAGDQKEPEPRRGRRPAGAVGLAPAGGPARGFLRRSTLHTISIPA